MSAISLEGDPIVSPVLEALLAEALKEKHDAALANECARQQRMSRRAVSSLLAQQGRPVE